MVLMRVEIDSYQMPELPEELKIDPVLSALLHMACFMELSGEKTVDFDESLGTLEAMGYYLQRLTPDQAKEINKQLKRIVAYGKKQKWKKEAVSFISRFLKNAGIGD